MTDDRLSGLALIAGSVGTIITMLWHPSGRDLFAPGQLESAARMVVATHTLALISLPVLFLGALGLSRRLGSADRLSIVALVAYGVAVVAAMNAAVASGFLTPSLARETVAASPEASEGWRILLHYNHYLNQAFALVLVVASSTAIVLWSFSMVRSRALAPGLGIYGLLLGPATIIAVVSGHLRLDVHGFGLVVFGQAVWFILAGALLCRVKKA